MTSGVSQVGNRLGLSAVLAHRSKSPARRGSVMVEFMLVAPLLFLTLLGALDGALAMASVGGASFVANDIARADSEESGGGSATPDQTAIDLAMQHSFFQMTSLTNILHIDVYPLVSDPNAAGVVMGCPAGSPFRLEADPNVPGAAMDNRFAYSNGAVPMAGPAGSTPWGTTRQSAVTSSEYIGVTIVFEYPWKTGVLSLFGTGGAPCEPFQPPVGSREAGSCPACLRLSASAIVKPEPTSFAP